jgi:hypothetical protein
MAIGFPTRAISSITIRSISILGTRDSRCLYKVPQSVSIVSYLPLQMESVREQVARVQLAGHPASRHRIPNSSLPLPAFDPNPLLTLALYDLWADLFPYFRPHPSGTKYSFGAPGLPTRLDVLRAIKTSLVSSVL